MSMGLDLYHNNMDQLKKTFNRVFKGKISIFLDLDTLKFNVIPKSYVNSYTTSPELVSPTCQLAYTYNYNELRNLILFTINNNLKEKEWEEIITLYKLTKEDHEI